MLKNLLTDKLRDGKVIHVGQNFNQLDQDLDQELAVERCRKTKGLCFRRSTYQPDNPKEWDKMCRTAQATLSPIQRLQIYRLVYLRHSNIGRFKFQLIETYLALGIVKPASHLVTEVLEAEPNNWQAQSLFAKISESCSRWHIAKEQWIQLHKLRPKNPLPVRGLIRSYEQLGDLKKALTFYKVLFDLEKETPLDRYNYAQLTAWDVGVAFTAEDAQKVLELFPDDTPLLARYASKLSLGGQFDESLQYLEEMKPRGLKPSFPLDLAIANTYQALQQFEIAAEQYLHLYEHRPQNINLLLNAATCIAKQGRIKEGIGLLDQLGNWHDCPPVLLRYAGILRLAGDMRGAFRASLAAVRHQSSTNNVVNLCQSLWDLGLVRSTERVVKRLSNRPHSHLNARKWAAIYAFKLKRFPQAAEEFRAYLKARPEDWQVVGHYADAVWQQGDAAEYYFAKLAFATNTPHLLNGTTDVRKSAFENIKSQIRRILPNLSSRSGANQKGNAARQLRRLVPNPYLVKSTSFPSAITRQMIREISECEKHGNAGPLEGLERERLPNFIAANGNPETSASLLYRLAKIYEQSGHIPKAMKFVSQALKISRDDHFLLNYYRQLLCQASPFLQIKDRPAVPVLLLTCLPNLERAKDMASTIHQQTGRTVVALWGEPDLNKYVLTPTPFGHELIVPCSDDYISLPEKLLLAYRFFAVRSNCTGVLKLDDDIVLKNSRKFESLIHRCHADASGYVGKINTFQNPVFHHGRHQLVGAVPPVAVHEPVQYCNGGQGYYLSKKNLRIILVASLTHYALEDRSAIYEDVYFGEILSRYGVPPTPLQMTACGGYVHDIYESLKLVDISPGFFLQKENELSED